MIFIESLSIEPHFAIQLEKMVTVSATTNKNTIKNTKGRMLDI